MILDMRFINDVHIRDIGCTTNITDLLIPSGWWFGTFFIFHYIGNFIIPIDELIFFRWVGQPPTSHLTPRFANMEPWKFGLQLNPPVLDPRGGPSGNDSHFAVNHHFSWENPLFLWPCSIAIFNYQMVCKNSYGKWHSMLVNDYNDD